ncbi:hypothetical protein DV515_00001984 [Chloebia gouldiae]|uniref:Uncharacterized protein n=1 Tax=Chloebia gouldiae TaxID=44316 RepID=A0A3L8SYL8_CHLGU|nr:hypothetical protein DV515_00001984 [Chloebia gouldiae]
MFAYKSKAINDNASRKHSLEATFTLKGLPGMCGRNPQHNFLISKRVQPASTPAEELDYLDKGEWASCPPGLKELLDCFSLGDSNYELLSTCSLKKLLTLGLSVAAEGGVRALGNECSNIAMIQEYAIEGRSKRKKSEFQKKYYTILLMQVNITDHFGRRYHKPLWIPLKTDQNRTYAAQIRSRPFRDTKPDLCWNKNEDDSCNAVLIRIKFFSPQTSLIIGKRVEGPRVQRTTTELGLEHKLDTSSVELHGNRTKAILQHEQPCLALQDDQQSNGMGGVSLGDWESLGMCRHVGAPGKLCRMDPSGGHPLQTWQGAGTQPHLGSALLGAALTQELQPERRDGDIAAHIAVYKSKEPRLTNAESGSDLSVRL